MEPQEDLDVFGEVRRELREELSFDPSDIADMQCVGLVEDTNLHQPELIFVTRSTLSRVQIESRLDHTEHVATYALRAERDAVDRAVADALLTPVAAATLTLWAANHLPST